MIAVVGDYELASAHRTRRNFKLILSTLRRHLDDTV
jgi:hypothetical protein